MSCQPCLTAAGSCWRGLATSVSRRLDRAEFTAAADGGVTWKRISGTGGLPLGPVSFLTGDPGNPASILRHDPGARPARASIGAMTAA